MPLYVTDNHSYVGPEHRNYDLCYLTLSLGSTMPKTWIFFCIKFCILSKKRWFGSALLETTIVTQKDTDTKIKQSEINRQMLMKVTVNRFQRVASNQNNLQIISLSAICECFVGATAAQVCTSRLINDETRKLF